MPSNPPIKIQRGSVTLGASEDTKDFTLGSSVASYGAGGKAFVRLCHSWVGGAHSSATTASNLEPRDHSCTVELISTSAVRVTRRSDANNEDIDVEFEVWEYIPANDPGGNNEFIVRAQATVSSDTPVQINSVTTFADLAAFHCGTNCRYPWLYRSSTTRIFLYESGGNDYVDADRSTIDSIDTIISVVEFIGSNWSVEQVDHTFSSASTTENETITDVGSWDSTFIIGSVEYNGGNAPKEMSCIVWPGSSTTQLRFRINNVTTTTKATAFVISNSDSTVVSVVHNDSVDGTASELADSSTTETISITAVSDVDYSSIILFALSDSADTSNESAGLWTYKLNSTTQISLKSSRSDDSASGGHVAYQVIEFITIPDVIYPAIYEASFDLGILLSNAKFTLSYEFDKIAGDPALTTTLSTSTDNVIFSDNVDTNEVIAIARYGKVKFEISASSNSEFGRVKNIKLTVNVQKEVDSSNDTSTETGFKTVYFNRSYSLVDAINITPVGDGDERLTSIVVFDYTQQDPKFFRMKLVDENGDQKAVGFGWDANGILKIT